MFPHGLCERFAILAIAMLIGLAALMFSGQTALAARDTNLALKERDCAKVHASNLAKRGLDGDVNAQYTLAWMNANGHCIPRNLLISHYWLEMAARHGNPDALYTQATAYENGDGVDRDLNRANQLYKQAAKKGHAKAQFQLGINYIRGFGDDPRREEGLYWMGSAVTHGHALSALLMGRLYEEGLHGVTKNRCLARDWYEAASSLGMESGLDHVARITSAGFCAE